MFYEQNGLEAYVPRFSRFGSWNLCEITEGIHVMCIFALLKIVFLDSWYGQCYWK